MGKYKELKISAVLRRLERSVVALAGADGVGWTFFSSVANAQRQRVSSTLGRPQTPNWFLSILRFGRKFPLFCEPCNSSKPSFGVTRVVSGGRTGDPRRDYVVGRISAERCG
jgi:hypothetical protein